MKELVAKAFKVGPDYEGQFLLRKFPFELEACLGRKQLFEMFYQLPARG
jgi:hypothetical protein